MNSDRKRKASVMGNGICGQGKNFEEQLLRNVYKEYCRLHEGM